MQLLLFDDNNSWIDVEGDFKVKVDYCDIKQQMKLEMLLDNYRREEDIEKQTAIFYEYVCYYIKYHVKDWVGVTNGDHSIDIQLVNNEMLDKLWRAFCNNSILVWKTYSVIADKLKFDDSDKKK